MFNPLALLILLLTFSMEPASSVSVEEDLKMTYSEKQTLDQVLTYTYLNGWGWNV